MFGMRRVLGYVIDITNDPKDIQCYLVEWGFIGSGMQEFCSADELEHWNGVREMIACLTSTGK
jgi:hypothetical protein